MPTSTMAQAALPEIEERSPWDTRAAPPPTKRPRCASAWTASKKDALDCSPTWKVADVVKAACLLSIPPLPTDFINEHEMRTVYSLIYDVFRYKNVLSQTLQDVGFYFLHPEYKHSSHVVWLLLYELHVRRYRERPDREASECQSLFDSCKCTPPLAELENTLWLQRTRIAAAISRLRIARNALRLSDLLPEHLRDNRVNQGRLRQPVTAWVNKNKVAEPIDAVNELNDTLGMQPLDVQTGERRLSPSRYAWDALCPMFLCFHPSCRSAIACCPAVCQHRLILQNRSFCYGPAMFCKLIYELELAGSAIITHVSSPRSLAYLAALISQNENVVSLLAFGAGERKLEFEQYMQQLNVGNVQIHSKRLVDMDLSTDIFENVVAVFAAPPNSCSAVADPVDLVCGRGGDLGTLELLTDTEDSAEGKARVTRMLEEQRSTLALAMSRPQVQFVLYETHSGLETENELMVRRALLDLNHAARHRHAELRGRVSSERLATEINNNEDKSELAMENDAIDDDDSSSESEGYADVKVPATDEFEQVNLPDLCFNSDSCLQLKEEGCFLALLQRKEVINLNSKYMIKMAEARGLFGANMGETSTVRKPQKQTMRQTKTPSTNRRRKTNFATERIGAQTYSSIMRSYDPKKCDCEQYKVIVPCPRHVSTAPTIRTSDRLGGSNVEPTPARRWWAETARYLTRLKRSLIRQKLVRAPPPPMLDGLLPRNEERERALEDIRNIDEILAKMPNVPGTGTIANIPPFPRLRLSRAVIRQERIPFPVYNCSVELPERRYY